MSTRKKWAASWDGRPRDLAAPGHSKKAVYDWIAKAAAELSRSSYPPIVNVWVDEGLGRGWERYERVDLREHAAARGRGGQGMSDDVDQER